MSRATRWLGSAPIAAAQIGAVSFAVADVAWVARPSVIGWLPALRALGAALGLGLAVGFVAGVLAGALFSAAPGLRRPSPGAVLGAPVAAVIWAGGFAGATLLAAFRLNDPALAAWAVALLALALTPLALIAAMIAARLAAPLARADKRNGELGRWMCAGAAVAGSLAVLWLRPLGLAFGALAIAILASRLRSPRPRWTGAAAALGLALAVSPLCDDPVARRAVDDTSVIPTVEAALAPLLDRDGDGYLAILGSGDCDEGNAAVSPAAVEVAGNGVDEDCRFGDLAPAPTPPAPGAARARAVLLLTIGGDAGDLSRTMPELDRALAGAVRFTGARGIAGRFVDVAPVLVDGVLPLEHRGAHGGFGVDGRSLPAMVENAGGRAAFSAKGSLRVELNTAFHLSRQKRKGKAAEAARRFASTLQTRLGLLWLHLDAADDDAAAAAVRAAAARDRVAVLVVALPSRDGGGASIAGGPIALLAPGLEPGRDERPAGLHDVYPTIADLLGLAIAERPRLGAPGRSLLDSGARVGVAGAITGGVLELVAFDGDAWARHLPRARRFETSSGRLGEDDRGAGAVAPLIELLRERYLAPRLAALNHRRAARVDAVPDDAGGSPSTVARALVIHGCATERRASDLVADVYMSGAGLEADDVLAFKLFAPGATSVRGRVHPAIPFDQLERGALFRQRLEIDTRSLGGGTWFLWIGVGRGETLLPVTSGSGSTPQWALVCRVEPPEGDR